MVSAIIYQLTRNLSETEIASSPYANYFVDHTTGVYPIAASGVPFDAKYIGVKGDTLADIHEDMAADGTTTKEQPVKTKCQKPLILEGTEKGVFFINERHTFFLA